MSCGQCARPRWSAARRLIALLLRGSVNIVSRLLRIHVVVLGRSLEVVHDDVARLVSLINLAAAAIHTHGGAWFARGVPGHPAILACSTAMPLTWAQVRAWRLERHHLTHRSTPTEPLAALVRDMCGVHAQLMSPAELSVKVRRDETSVADVRAALYQERRLFKTWAMRGTLHLLPSTDVALYVAALRPRTAARLDLARSARRRPSGGRLEP